MTECFYCGLCYRNINNATLIDYKNKTLCTRCAAIQDNLTDLWKSFRAKKHYMDARDDSNLHNRVMYLRVYLNEKNFKCDSLSCDYKPNAAEFPEGIPVYEYVICDQIKLCTDCFAEHLAGRGEIPGAIDTSSLCETHGFPYLYHKDYGLKKSPKHFIKVTIPEHEHWYVSPGYHLFQLQTRNECKCTECTFKSSGGKCFCCHTCLYYRVEFKGWYERCMKANLECNTVKGFFDAIGKGEEYECDEDDCECSTLYECTKAYMCKNPGFYKYAKKQLFDKIRTCEM